LLIVRNHCAITNAFRDIDTLRLVASFVPVATAGVNDGRLGLGKRNSTFNKFL
jgi:hypothetical protein